MTLFNGRYDALFHLKDVHDSIIRTEIVVDDDREISVSLVTNTETYKVPYKTQAVLSFVNMPVSEYVNSLHTIATVSMGQLHCCPFCSQAIVKSTGIDSVGNQIELSYCPNHRCSTHRLESLFYRLSEMSIQLLEPIKEHANRRMGMHVGYRDVLACKHLLLNAPPSYLSKFLYVPTELTDYYDNIDVMCPNGRSLINYAMSYGREDNIGLSFLKSSLLVNQEFLGYQPGSDGGKYDWSHVSVNHEGF